MAKRRVGWQGLRVNISWHLSLMPPWLHHCASILHVENWGQAVHARRINDILLGGTFPQPLRLLLSRGPIGRQPSAIAHNS